MDRLRKRQMRFSAIYLIAGFLALYLFVRCGAPATAVVVQRIRG